MRLFNILKAVAQRLLMFFEYQPTRNYYAIDNTHGFTTTKAKAVLDDLITWCGSNARDGAILISNGYTYTGHYFKYTDNYACIMLFTYGNQMPVYILSKAGTNTYIVKTITLD